MGEDKIDVPPAIVVKTAAEHNQETKLFYRAPKNYSSVAKHTYRVLVYFGGRNTTGEREAQNSLNFGAWADENDIFIVAPGFKDDDYWHPDKWSGKALILALKEIKKQYNICTTHLLYYGFSAGSQCSNLFPAWSPKNAVAFVSHGCGVFYEPSPAMRKVPGLVTCGDADIQRYIISRRFVAGARKAGQNIIFKSFPNLPHSVNPDSYQLAQAFLLYHHLRNLNDLKVEAPEPPKEEVAFVGDDTDGVFYDPTAKEVDFIVPEDRVNLPTLDIAKAWGKYQLSRYAQTASIK